MQHGRTAGRSRCLYRGLKAYHQTYQPFVLIVISGSGGVKLTIRGQPMCSLLPSTAPVATLDTECFSGRGRGGGGRRMLNRFCYSPSIPGGVRLRGAVGRLRGTGGAERAL